MLGTWIDLGVFEKDKWRAYVMHVKHSSSSDGLIELWRDGVKILNRSGANMYAVTGDYHNPKLKLGIYKSDWNGSGTTQTTQRVIYFDDIKMGNEYVELAYLFFDAGEPAFVNAVLDRLAQTLRTQGPAI